MTANTISALTVEYLGSDATAEDLVTFQNACRNYAAANDCTEEEAMDAVWNDGDFAGMVAEWSES